MEGLNKVEQILSNVKEYAETRFDLVAINTQDKVSDVLSSIASVVVVSILSLFIVFFGSVGVAWWIGQLAHNPSIGFFSVAGFYLLVTIIVYVNRDKWIKLPIINSLLKKININEEN